MIGIHAILLQVAFWILGLFLLTGAISGLIRLRKLSNVFSKTTIDHTHGCLFILILGFSLLRY